MAQMIDRLTRGAMVAVAMFCASAPVLAQSEADLPDRPITRKEVVAGVKRQFIAMDANHDGVVSRAEFDAYRAQQQAGSPGTSGAGIAAFGHIGSHWYDRADAQGDGRVTLAEAEARPLQLFDMADTNGDGVVSLDERKVAMMLMSFGAK